MRPFLRWRQTAGLLLLVLMTACGGGGGDAPAANPGTSTGQPQALGTWKVTVIPPEGQVPTQGESLLLKASGTGSALSTEWDFGDGVVLLKTSVMEATHTFAKAGDFTVVVTVFGAGGDRVTSQSIVKVLPPRLKLSIGSTVEDQVPLLRGARARFAANTVWSGTGRAEKTPAGLRYRWTFSDGGTSEAPALAHLFSTVGTHEVTLTVTDEYGRATTASRTITVSSEVKPTVLQTNFGGPGAMNDGPFTLLGSPRGMARGKDGSVYVMDGANGVIRKVAPDGEVSDFAGASGMSGYIDSIDGIGGEARLGNPYDGLAIDASGTLYFAEAGLLRSVSPKGEVKTFDKAQLVGNDEAELKRYWGVRDLTVAPDGALYFVDGARVMRLKDGRVNVVAATPDRSPSDVNLPTEHALFGGLTAIAARPDGTLLVLDCYGVRKVSPDGMVGTLFKFTDAMPEPGNTYKCGFGQALSTAADGRVLMLWDRALHVIEADDTVRTVAMQIYADRVLPIDANIAWISDSGRHVIEWINLTNGTHATQVGRRADDNQSVFPPASTGTGQVQPSGGIAVDRDGNVLFTDGAGIQRFYATSSNTLLNMPNNGWDMVDGLSGDAKVARAQFPATDAAGNLYFVDRNQTVRRMAASDRSIRTISGSATAGTADGTGVGPRFEGIRDLVAAPDGTVYVMDGVRDDARRLVRVRPDGETTTLMVLSQQTSGPMAVMRSGQLLMVVQGELRRLESDNMWTTVAGGRNPPSRSRWIGSARPVVSPSGQIYLIESESRWSVLRRVEADGTIVDLAQDGPLSMDLGTGREPVELPFSFASVAFMPDGRLMVWAGQPHSWWTLSGLR